MDNLNDKRGVVDVFTSPDELRGNFMPACSRCSAFLAQNKATVDLGALINLYGVYSAIEGIRSSGYHVDVRSMLDGSIYVMISEEIGLIPYICTSATTEFEAKRDAVFEFYEKYER